MTPRLLEDWPAVAERLRAARSIVLCLDFDGTLAPLVDAPQKAVMDRAARAALTNLAANPRVRTSIVSGRRSSDLRKLVAIPGVEYLGVHGYDSPGYRLPAAAATAVWGALGEVKSRLNGALLNGTKGIAIEDKGISFAVHFRSAGHPDISHARKLLESAVASRAHALRMVSGDCVWEVLPHEIRGKGAAVRRLWRLRSPSSLPIYIGNDATDEPAYRALTEGITARVGVARPTRAHYALKDPREAARFLEMLDREMEWKHGQSFNS